MTRRLWIPACLTLACAALAGILASSIEATYEATASARLFPLVPTTEIDRLRAGAGLPQVEESSSAPFTPARHDVVRNALRRVNRAGPGAQIQADDARILDTGAVLISPLLREPVRRLKAKVRAPSPQAASMAATRFLRAYLDERDRAYDRVLAETRKALAEKRALAKRASTRARIAEAADAARVISLLDGNGVFLAGFASAREPKEAVSPRVSRDVVVAGIIGCLLGLILTGRGVSPKERTEAQPPVT